MKKGITILVSILLLLALTACGGEKTTGPEVDYGSSDLYSKEEMDAAITAIRAEFDTWDGCELHTLRYAGDESASQENLDWMNELRKDGDAFTQCIEFLSDFHSPKDEAASSALGLEADREYQDWQWWLARSEDGDWQLMTWGY